MMQAKMMTRKSIALLSSLQRHRPIASYSHHTIASLAASRYRVIAPTPSQWHFVVSSSLHHRAIIIAPSSSRCRVIALLTRISIWCVMVLRNPIRIPYILDIIASMPPNFLLRLYDSVRASENFAFFALHKDNPEFHYHSFFKLWYHIK